jgi:HK97 family phage major capsid protein
VEVNADYECDAVVLHPNDWRDIKLLRTADGQYIFGSPSSAIPPQMWGKRVVSTTRLAEGTGLVGAFKGAALLSYRSALEISVSDSHSDYFIKNKLAVRAEIRVALSCFRPAAFATVSGI